MGMHHRNVIALAAIFCCLLNNSYGLSSEDDLLANKCPSSVVLPTHGSSRSVIWTPPYAHNRTGILKHIQVHPKDARPPFEATKGVTHIKYTLTLENGEETSCSFNITVFEGIKIVKKPLSQYNIQEGSIFPLPCKADSPDGDPISYKWLLNDALLTYDSHREWKAHIHELQLRNLKTIHSGKYTCVAYTTGERISEASVSTNININEKLKIVNWPVNTTLKVMEGSSLSLPCKANYPDDDGKVKYSWSFNWEEIDYDNRIEWRASDYELLIKSAQVKDSGIYSCYVTAYSLGFGAVYKDIDITIYAERFSFTAWGAWSECISNSGSNIGHRTRFRTCVTSSEIEAPGRCSGNSKQVENCDIEISSQPPPTPTPTKAGSKRKEEAIIAVRKASTPEEGKTKFLGTFYGKLALGSSLAILVVILGCAVFVLVGRRIEKKDKKRRKGYKPIKDLEDPPFNDGPSKEEYSDDYEDEMDRKAFEKRQVIKELTPKERKRSELDDDLIVARAVILEEGIDKDHERDVVEKRKMVVNTTSSSACKKSLLESINSSRAIILDKDTTEVDNTDKTSVSFSPHKVRISSGGSSRGSSYHSIDGTKDTQNGDDEDSFSMMMVQPVQPELFEARQATIKHTQDFDQAGKS